MSYPNDAPTAAWYPDPQTPGQVRWWDGTNWTEHVSVPAPTAVVSESTAVESAAVESPQAVAEPEYIGRHAAGAQPAPRHESNVPRIRPRVRVELTVEEPVLEYVYA
jgi:Protein of unknown function (DUF2510)